MLASLLPLAAEAASDDKSGLIKPIPGLMIWTLLSFLIAFLVLRKFAFGPIQQIIDPKMFPMPMPAPTEPSPIPSARAIALP